MNQPSKTCINCTLPIRGLEAEGDRPICLQCLASLRPHTTFHENTFGYSTIEGCIRQSTNNPINKTNKMNILPTQEVIPKFVHCPRCKKAYQTRRNGQPVVFVINEQGAGFIDVDLCTMPSCKKNENTVLK